jgi:protein TonB
VAAGKSGDTEAPDSGSGDQSAGGGKVGDRHDYLATLAAWLERHKQYPRQARARGEEGTVLLRFTIDRLGRLQAWRIDRGSGSAALDREVGTMLQRAEPLPPMPDSMAQAQLELVVPIRFRLR